MALRFALLGCGVIARKHAEAITGHVEGAKVVAFCDLDIQKAQSFADKFGARAFGSTREMIEKFGASIDVVSVLTPTGFHCKSVIEVAGYGKHVVVEKPMAIGVADARRMLDACRASGVELFVVKQNRFNRPIQFLHRALEQNRLGDLVMVTARVRWSRDATYYARDAWRGTALLDGGVLENQASHHLDLLQWIGGPVQSVFCTKSRRIAAIETEDTAIATLKFQSGALGVIEATTATRPKDLEGSVSVLGSGGSVEIGGFAANRVLTWQFVEPSEEDDDIRTVYASNPEGEPVYAHAQYLRQVVAKLSGKEAMTVSGEEGLKTVELLEAMQRSHETGMVVGIAGTSSGRAPPEKAFSELEAVG